MPIYAYRCEACGFAKDVLQKMSDDPLTVCPECQQASFKKQITAAGFQLKGSGWYVTDFRGGSGSTAPTEANGANGTDGSNATKTAPTAPTTNTNGTSESSSSSATPSTTTDTKAA